MLTEEEVKEELLEERWEKGRNLPNIKYVFSYEDEVTPCSRRYKKKTYKYFSLLNREE